jgi:hypothetical protein
MNVALEDHPKIVAFPPLLWLIGATVSALVHFFVFSIPILPEPFALILGIVCMLVGPSLALPALLTMRAAGTLNDWITLLFVVPLALVLHFGVILPEERYLEAKFGERYLALKREVRRWI